jgi:anti-anti-sigma factor
MERRICVGGEIDMASADALRAELQRAIEASSDAHLLLDCTHLTFLDSSGVRVLLDTHVALEAQGRHMLLVNLGEGPSRLFEVLGITDLLRVERSSALLAE